MTCRECVHYEICRDSGILMNFLMRGERVAGNVESKCPFKKFKNKADFVELVRCKGCKFVHINSSSGSYHCKRRGHYSEEVKQDDFCSYGERK